MKKLPIKSLIKDYLKGYSLTDLEHKYGYSRDRLSAALNLHVDLKPGGIKFYQTPANSIKNIIRMYKTGKYTQAQLAKKFGVTAQTISRWCREAGIHRRSYR